MQEVIDELLKAEAEAQKTITQAQEQAQKRKNQVETECSLKVNETREQSRRMVMDRVEQARQSLEKANAGALEKAKADMETRFRGQQQTIDDIADQVIDLIMTPEYERDEE